MCRVRTALQYALYAPDNVRPREHGSRRAHDLRDELHVPRGESAAPPVISQAATLQNQFTVYQVAGFAS